MSGSSRGLSQVLITERTSTGWHRMDESSVRLFLVSASDVLLTDVIHSQSYSDGNITLVQGGFVESAVVEAMSADKPPV